MTRLKQALAFMLGMLARVPGVAAFTALIGRLAEAGTSGYPTDVKRRLMIPNMFAYLVMLTTAVADGFLDEVRQLRARGDLHADLPSMRCVGYRQAWELLDAQASATPFPIERLRECGIAATRQLAKRQITWLRSMPERLIVPCDHPDALAKVLAQVDQLVAKRARP